MALRGERDAPFQSPSSHDVDLLHSRDERRCSAILLQTDEILVKSMDMTLLIEAIKKEISKRTYRRSLVR